MVAHLLEAHIGLRTDASVVIYEARLVAIQPGIDECGADIAILCFAFEDVILLPMTDNDEVVRIHANGAHASVLQQKRPGTDALRSKHTAPDISFNCIRRYEDCGNLFY
jgi:hypothetical protein